MAEAEEAPKKEAESAPKGPSKLPMIVALLNTLALMGALGLFAYTKLLYKKPKITEKSQRQQIQEIIQQQSAHAEPGRIFFKTMTVNLAPSEQTPGNPRKTHYATMSFSLEIRDILAKENFEAVRTQFTDQLIEHMGKKSYQDVTNVQGRYILRSEIVDLANHLMKDTLVSDMYFTEFVVQ